MECAGQCQGIIGTDSILLTVLFLGFSTITAAHTTTTTTATATPPPPPPHYHHNHNHHPHHFHSVQFLTTFHSFPPPPQAKGKGPSVALELIDRLKSTGVTPTVHMFTSVLNAMIDRRQYDDAQEVATHSSNAP